MSWYHLARLTHATTLGCHLTRSSAASEGNKSERSERTIDRSSAAASCWAAAARSIPAASLSRGPLGDGEPDGVREGARDGLKPALAVIAAQGVDAVVAELVRAERDA